MITFESPYLLAGIVLCSAVIGYVFYTQAKGKNGRPRNIIQHILRLLTLSSLLIALSGPFTTTEKSSAGLLALVDISTSMNERVGQTLLERAEKLAAQLNTPLTILPFAKNASPLTSDSSSFTQLKNSWQQLDLGATDISTAINSANGFGDRKALLITDGYETVGNSAERISSSGSLSLYPLVEDDQSTLQSAQLQGLSITQLYAPLTAKAETSVDIRTTVTNSANEPRSATLSVKHGDKILSTRQIVVPANQDLVVVTPSDPTAEGLKQITSEIRWDSDGTPRQELKVAWISGEKREKVLLISGDADDARLLPSLLRGQTYQVESLSPNELSNSKLNLKDYRVIILNNVARNQLTRSLEDEIPRYTKAGGGFVMIGGNRGFGAGRYIDSPIEEILPVKLVPPSTEKKRLNVAVQLVIDKSRSMGAENRLSYVKDAAIHVVQNLKDDDYIGVIGFADSPFIAQPLALVQDVRSQVVDRITRIYANGGTQMFPAIDEGRRALQRVNAGRKHMIILTDGKVADAGEYYYQLVKQLRTLGVTVSTIMLGADVDDDFMAQLAAIGGGRFYPATNPQNLVNIFLSDVRVNTGERSLKESTFFAVNRGPDGLSSTLLTDFPNLRGYVECLRNPEAKTELVVTAEGKSAPLLASWDVGKGRSLAFTSDANGRWSSDWMRWSEISQFWSDIIQKAQNHRSQKAEKQIEFDLRSSLEQGQLILNLTLYSDAAGDRITGELKDPGGALTSVEFNLIKPGYYQAKVSKPLPGKQQLSIKVGDVALPELAWNLPGELFGEIAHDQANVQHLERLASISNGKVNPSAEDLKSTSTPVKEKHDKSSLFLIAALLLFFLELIVREFRFLKFTPKRF